MPAAIVTCSNCGSALDPAALGGLCPRCVALDFFTPTVAGGQAASTPFLDDAEHRLGDYELIEEIARGGMGVVYRARQTSLGRDVALKMVLNGVLAGDMAIARFKVEATAAAGLSHPNIVPIHEIGEDRGRHYFSMEFVAGRTLADILRDGPLPAKIAAGYVERVAAAVHYAHTRGVVHRDLKPSNILIDGQDQPKVTDFGLAKRSDGEGELTLSGQILGTPAYMSPEQAGGARFGAVGARSDVYSLGAVLYHAMCGLPPFSGESATEILHKVTNDEPVAPRLLNPALPRDLETICLKSLAKESSRRYVSALELAEDLGHFLRGEPILARPVGRIEKLWRWSRREPALAAALGGCLAILVVGVSGILWQLRQTKAAQAVAVQKAKDEETQRKAAQQSELVMRQNLYAADVLGAQRSLEQNDLGTARLRLDAHRPQPGQADLRGFEWRYYWAKAKGDSFRTISNQWQAGPLAFSPDGKWFAYGVRDVVVCDAATFQERARAKVPGVASIAFIPNTQTLLIGTRRPSLIKRWNWLESGDPPLFVDPHGLWPNVAVSPITNIMAVGCGTTTYSGDDDGTAMLCDLATGAPRHTLPESGGMVAFSPDGRRLATGAWEGAIKLWDPDTGKLTGVLTNAYRVLALRFSPDESTLAVCCFSEGLWLYDLATGAQRAFARVPGTYTCEAAFSQDGATVATCSPDGTVRLWDLKSGHETACWHGHGYQANCVAWSPDGKFVVSGGADATVRFWKTDLTNSAATAFSGRVKRNLFSHDGHLLAFEGTNEQVTLYDYPSLKAVSAPETVGQPLGFRADPTALVTVRASQNPEGSELVEWSVPDLQPLRTNRLPGSARSMSPCVLSPDARLLAASPAPGEILLWDLATGAKPTRLPAPEGQHVGMLNFSPDGRLLAGGFNSIQSSTAVFLWDTGTGQSVTNLAGHRGFLNDTAFSADGRILASVAGDQNIKVWDVAERKELATLSGSRGSSASVDISPDGKTIATGSYDRILCLWNLPTRREVTRLDMPHWPVSLTFAPDGNALFIGQKSDKDSPTSTVVWRAPSLAETDQRP